jgi:putative SOS response-associated peptidase YedK
MFNARAEGLLTKPIFSRLVGFPRSSSKAKGNEHLKKEHEEKEDTAAAASDGEGGAGVGAAEGQAEGSAGRTETDSKTSTTRSSGRRCVVVMNGFYEWKAEGARKQPYYIHRGEEVPLLCAGLYDTWKGKGCLVWGWEQLLLRLS